jgi:hypothetical protein
MTEKPAFYIRHSERSAKNLFPQMPVRAVLLGIIRGVRFFAARRAKRTRVDLHYTGRGRSRSASTIQKNPNLPFAMALN